MNGENKADSSMTTMKDFNIGQSYPLPFISHASLFGLLVLTELFKNLIKLSSPAPCGKLKENASCAQYKTQKIASVDGSHNEHTCRQACRETPGCGIFLVHTGSPCYLYKTGAEKICTGWSSQYVQYALRECNEKGKKICKFILRAWQWF